MTTLNMPDKTTSCSEDRKETCGLCYTSSVVSKLTLPCGHSVCRHCYALDLNIRDLMLTDSCHICQRNGGMVTMEKDVYCGLKMLIFLEVREGRAGCSVFLSDKKILHLFYFQ